VAKPILLDLYCKAGGCTKGYQRAGFFVVGVDIEPQPNYCGDEFVERDALEVLQLLIDGKMIQTRPGRTMNRWDLAAVHASPPCQAHSDLAWHPQNRDNVYPELVGPTRDLLIELGLPYVIENVEGAPLLEPTTLCGSSFGLPIQRHRLFETNFPMMGPGGCAHGALPKKYKVWRHGVEMDSAFVPVYGAGGGKAAEHWAEAMGIDWMTRAELAQAIPPAYTEHVGAYLLEAVKRNQEEKKDGEQRVA
jgi:DNA (cytosine-5)-methyltransferase 1